MPSKLAAAATAALLCSCRETSRDPRPLADPGAQGPAAAPKAAPPADLAVTPPASASAEPPAPQGAEAAEQDERLNEGCKHRKNSRVVVRCEKAQKSSARGAWAPTRDELGKLMPQADGACYCASGLAEPVLACARMQGTSAVHLVLGRQSDPVDCAFDLRPSEHAGRRFVVVDAFNRDRATFYSVVQIFEREASGFRPYFRGYNRIPLSLAEVESSDDVSAKMRSEWDSLPVEWKRELRGE
jgi:hypothetical protein